MEDDIMPQPHKLPNKPLIEAIFELRWELLEREPHGIKTDPGFEILVGRYYERIKEEYPYIEKLPISEIPEVLTAHTVRHRFRAANNQWPVTQIGPGIITINETDGYVWNSFKPRIIKVLKAFFESYPSETNPNPITTELRSLVSGC